MVSAVRLFNEVDDPDGCYEYWMPLLTTVRPLLTITYVCPRLPLMLEIAVNKTATNGTAVDDSASASFRTLEHVAIYVVTHILARNVLKRSSGNIEKEVLLHD